MLLLPLLMLFAGTSFAQQQDQQTKNLESFAKLYGYVKYFHPSDQASAINWDNFAIYGASQVILCKTSGELATTLKQLFTPIAPQLNIDLTADKAYATSAGPKDDCEYTYWQHLGLGKDATAGGRIYSSSRVNALMTSKGNGSDFANLVMGLDASYFRNKEIKVSAMVKVGAGTEGNGRLWLRVDNNDSTAGFFDNMGDRPITDTSWKPYSIVGTISDKAERILLGSLLVGDGSIMVDNFKVSFRSDPDGPWKPFDLFNNSFEQSSISAKSDNSDAYWSTNGAGYEFTLDTDNFKDGKQAVRISSITAETKYKGLKLFDAETKPGEVVNKQIGEDIFVSVPLTLCIDKDRKTLPLASDKKLAELKQKLKTVQADPASLNTRLGNLVNAFNVFEHFYPYFEVINTDWNQAFQAALKKSFTDKTAADHLQTIREFTAQLKDGHVRVNARGVNNNYAPAFIWEIVEDQLIVTKILDSEIPLKVGDVVTAVNEQTTSEFLAPIYKGISAGTVGWRNHRAKSESMLGPEGSDLSLSLDNGKTVTVKRVNNLFRSWQLYNPKGLGHKPIGTNGYYVNLDVMPMDSINNIMPKLKAASGLIFDLRGYPNSNHQVISHLLKQRDTVDNWMHIPQLLYPHQKDKGFRSSGWQLSTKKPYLGDKKVVFIIDGGAISYAESFMGFIKGYKLATIVGQPTAGANGNVNRTSLPGGITISWTGMKVTKHNGDQHHAIGVLPDVPVTKTVQAVKQGRDEFLEKALEIIDDQ